MNSRLGARPFTALSRLGWAQALVTTTAAAEPGSNLGQQELRSARALADQAAGEFRRLDMPGPLTPISAQRVGRKIERAGWSGLDPLCLVEWADSTFSHQGFSRRH
jgi:hypothetical protein